MIAKFDKLVSGNQPVLVDFFATWCGPCNYIPPILKEVKNEMGDKVKIIKIDIDKNQVLANRYKVQSVPTLMLFKNGSIKWRQSGVVPAKMINKEINANL